MFSKSKKKLLPVIFHLCIFYIYTGQNYFFHVKLKFLISDLAKKITETKSNVSMEGHSYFTEFETLLDEFGIRENSCITLLIQLKIRRNLQIC